MSCCPDGAVDIFSPGAGTVVAIEDPAGLQVSFSVDSVSMGETFNDLKAIVTSIGIQAQGGYQFMHALREFIYVYVFTERVGEIVINGLAFPASCSSLGPQDIGNPPLGQTGLEKVLTWYETNRITARATPVHITFGAIKGYDAFLVHMKADIADAQTGIAQFSMHFNFIPVQADDDDFCFDVNIACLPGDPCGAQG